MWADLQPVGRSTPRPAATAASPGPARTTTCASGSPPSARARGLDLTEDRMGNQWAWWGDPDALRHVARHGRRHRLPPRQRPGRRRLRRPARRRQRLRRAGRAARQGFRARPPDRRRELRRRGGRPVRRRLRRLPGHHRRHDRPTAPAALTDADGTTMAEALAAAGRDPHSIGRDREALRRHRQPSSSCTSSRAAAWSTSTTPSPSAPTSGRTAAGGWTSPARPTTPARPGSRTATTPCSATPTPCSPRGTPPSTARLRRHDRQGRRHSRAASTPSPAPSPAGSTPEAPDEAPCVRAVADVEADGRSTSGGHRHRGVLDRRRRRSTPHLGARLRTRLGGIPCWAPAPGTTPASSPTRASPPPCSSSATPPASPTRPRSTPSWTTAWPGSRALTAVLEDLAGDAARMDDATGPSTPGCRPVWPRGVRFRSPTAASPRSSRRADAAGR